MTDVANALDLAGFIRGEGEITAKVFELAVDCPAQAAAGLLGQRAPNVPRRDSRPGKLLAWQTTVDLLRAALRRRCDARSAWAELPDSDVSRPAALRDFAIDVADTILDQIGAESEGWHVLADPAARIHGTKVRLRGAILLHQRDTGRALIYRVRLGDRFSGPDDIDQRRWAVIAASGVASTMGDLTDIAVREVSLRTGTVTAPVRWTRDELRARWIGDIRPGLAALRESPSHPRTGRHCTKCDHVFACPAPHQAPGLLGLDGQPWRIDISADSLRRYATCAHEYVLGDLYGIPGRRAGSAAADRGQLVHTCLADRHRSGAGCTNDDPRTASGDGDPGEDPRPYLAAHVDICPFRGDPSHDVAVEALLVVVDAQANVVLLATPDLRYTTVDGSRRWRETKTRPQARDITAEQLVDSDVVAATYVLLASSGVDGDVAELEWEVLTPDGATLTTIPVTDALVARARAIVAERVRALLKDDTWAPTTNAAYCIGCPFNAICPHSLAT